MVFCISNSTCACLAPIVDRLLPRPVWLEARPHSHGWDTLPRKDTLLQKDTLPGRTLCTGMTLSLRKIFCHKRILHFANTYLSCAVHFPWTIYFPKLIWFYFIHINVKWKFWSCCLIKSSKFQSHLPSCALLRNVHNHDHQTYLSQNLSQTYGAALPRINTV